jgi:hypothetical protein
VTPDRWQDYGPLETTTAPRSYVFDNEAPPTRSVQHRARTYPDDDVLPQPVAVDAVVFNDVGTRTLTVRLSDQASGYTRLLWQQAWQRQRRSQEAGWPLDGAPWIFADVPGAPGVVHGLPAEGGVMSFHFPPGTAGYSELISKPGLVAIVTLDRGTHQFLSCRFRNRRPANPYARPPGKQGK